MKTRPIGIFDSGVGGLTVLKAIERVLPSENIIYFGDTARVPYGNKSKSTIVKFSVENALFLLQKKVKVIVVACNTSSALALNNLKSMLSIPILGVIEAGVKKALSLTTAGVIGVIGTKSTIESKSYEHQILKINKKIKVYSQSCPLFVPLVEEAVLGGKILDEVLSLYLRGFKAKKVDTLILGCTHYPLLKRKIAAYLKGVNIVDSANEVANHVKEILVVKDLVNSCKRSSKKEFFLSDKSKEFKTVAKLFLKRNIPEPKIANV